MYKISICLACAVVCYVRGAPAADSVPTVVPIVSEEIVLETDGKFHYSFETGDGIKAHEEGDLKQIDDQLVETVKGGFEYTDPDGKSVSINYVADETGYHPTGDSIPVAPPVPPAIAKLVEYIEAHPEIHEAGHVK